MQADSAVHVLDIQPRVPSDRPTAPAVFRIVPSTVLRIVHEGTEEHTASTEKVLNTGVSSVSAVGQGNSSSASSPTPVGSAHTVDTGKGVSGQSPAAEASGQSGSKPKKTVSKSANKSRGAVASESSSGREQGLVHSTEEDSVCSSLAGSLQTTILVSAAEGSDPGAAKLSAEAPPLAEGAVEKKKTVKKRSSSAGKGIKAGPTKFDLLGALGEE